MEKQSYVVTLNGKFRVKVFAYDATGAAQKAETVYQFTTDQPESVTAVAAGLGLSLPSEVQWLDCAVLQWRSAKPPE